MTLKPCPCCGKEASFFASESYQDCSTSHSVECCACELSTALFPTQEAAASAWNHRPAEAELRAEVERLRTVCRWMAPYTKYQDQETALLNAAEGRWDDVPDSAKGE